MRLHRRALLLGILAGASGAAFLALAASAGVGGGAFFPLLALWLVLVVLLARLAQRLAGRLRRA